MTITNDQRRLLAAYLAEAKLPGTKKKMKVAHLQALLHPVGVENLEQLRLDKERVNVANELLFQDGYIDRKKINGSQVEISLTMKGFEYATANSSWKNWLQSRWPWMLSKVTAGCLAVASIAIAAFFHQYFRS